MIVICDENSKNKFHLFGLKKGVVTHVVFSYAQLRWAKEYLPENCSAFRMLPQSKMFYSYVIDKTILREELPKELQLYLVLMEM